MTARPDLRHAFAEHLLMLTRTVLPAKDARLAAQLVACDPELKRSLHFLASALFIYQQGTVQEIARRVVRSRRFDADLQSLGQSSELDHLVEHLSGGGKLLKSFRSHHAKRVLCRAKTNTIIFLDRCFLDWGVHHFHVYPNARGRNCLVYASFDDTTLYLLSLGGHSLLNDSVLVESMAEVCPHLLSTVAGVDGNDLEPAEVKALRGKNANFAVQRCGGAVVPRIPCSSGGLPVQTIREVDFEVAQLVALEGVLANPATEHYQQLQNSLKTVQPLNLRVVEDPTNFCGSLLLHDGTTGRQMRLKYR